jgi:hypothetical protein
MLASRAELAGCEPESSKLETEILRLTLKDYEEIRQHPRRFFNASGHESLSVDTGAGVVVERRERFVIVDKIGVAGEVAETQYDELGR